MAALLVVMFIVFVAIGVPISFALGVVSFVGINSLAAIPNTVVFSKKKNFLLQQLRISICRLSV